MIQFSSSSDTEATPAAEKIDTYVGVYQRSITQAESTAKWVLGIYAAIAVVLLAGSQLSSIGRLDAPEILEDYRLYIAVGGAALGLFAAGFVVWAAVSVLQVRAPGLDALEAEETRQLSRRKYQFWKRKSIDLEFAHSNLIVRNHRADATSPVLSACLEQLNKRSPATATTESAFNPDTPIANMIRHTARMQRCHRAKPEILDKEQLESLGASILTRHVEYDRLLWGIRANRVGTTLRRSTVWMFAAGTVAAASVITFAWAANPNSPPNPAVVRPIASLATVTFTDVEQQRLSRTLGADCVTESMSAVVLEAANQDLTAYQVAILPTETCPGIRVTVGEDGIGTFVD